MKNTRTGVYYIGDESYNFKFATTLSLSDKLLFVNSVVETVIDDGRYNSIIKDIVFDFMLIKMMTDVPAPYFVLDDIENFISETNIVDVIKENAENNLIDELSHHIDLSIEYLTGIHSNPLGEALSSLVNTLEKKVNEIDLSGAMEMVSKFAGMTGELTPESIVDAYIGTKK